MDLDAEVEQGVLALLQDADGLSEIRTAEAEVRECLFAGDRLTHGFRADELPALAVTAGLAPTRSVAHGTGEIRYTVPVTACIITRAQSKSAARKSALALMRAAERQLHLARRTNGALGVNSFVQGDLVSSVVVVEERPFYFAVGTVSAEITKVVSL